MPATGPYFLPGFTYQAGLSALLTDRIAVFSRPVLVQAQP